jgi:hypothetical protein
MTQTQLRELIKPLNKQERHLLRELLDEETQNGNSSGEQQVSQDNPLRGSILRYDDPFGPAAPLEDWEVLQ